MIDSWPAGTAAVPEVLTGPGRIEAHGGCFVSASTTLELEPTSEGANVRLHTVGQEPLTTTLSHDMLGAIGTEIRTRLPTAPSGMFSKSAFIVRIHLPLSGGAIHRELHEIGPWPGEPTVPNAEYVGRALFPVLEVIRRLISTLEKR